MKIFSLTNIFLPLFIDLSTILVVKDFSVNAIFVASLKVVMERNVVMKPIGVIEP